MPDGQDGGQRSGDDGATEQEAGIVMRGHGHARADDRRGQHE